MKVPSIQLRFFSKFTLIAFFMAGPAIKSQSSTIHAAAPSERHLRSRPLHLRPARPLLAPGLYRGFYLGGAKLVSRWEVPSSPTLAGASISSSSSKTAQRSRRSWLSPPTFNAITTRPSLPMVRRSHSSHCPSS